MKIKVWVEVDMSNAIEKEAGSQTFNIRPSGIQARIRKEGHFIMLTCKITMKTCHPCTK